MAFPLYSRLTKRNIRKQNMSLTSITLAKALKVKNRLAGRLNKLNSDILHNNSVLKENENKVNVEKLIASRDELVESLIQLKSALYIANSGIQETLYRLAEKKAEVQNLSALPTRDGNERHAYQNTEVVWVAYLKKEDVDLKVKKLESEIDAFQDSIDEYNNTKKIEINQKVLDLAS